MSTASLGLIYAAGCLAMFAGILLLDRYVGPDFREATGREFMLPKSPVRMVLATFLWPVFLPMALVFAVLLLGLGAIRPRK